MWFNKWCERYTFQYSQCHLLSTHSCQLYILHAWSQYAFGKRKDICDGVRDGTETLYNLWLIHFKFSLWSHIKLPRDVIILLMYQYRLHNFIDINRISCLFFVLNSINWVVDNYYIILPLAFSKLYALYRWKSLNMNNKMAGRRIPRMNGKINFKLLLSIVWEIPQILFSWNIYRLSFIFT